MKRPSTRKQRGIAKALGASRTVNLSRSSGGGPLDWLALEREVRQIRWGKSTQKTLPQARYIRGRERNPFSDNPNPQDIANWKETKIEAGLLRAKGIIVSPSDLAAFIIDFAISKLHPRIDRRIKNAALSKFVKLRQERKSQSRRN